MRGIVKTALALLAALLAGAGEAQPDLRADPAVWLRQVYAFYQHAQNNPALDPQVSGLVKRRASRALAALFKRDEECFRKSNKICALDWNYVIDGQDWEISQVKVGPLQARGDRATVTVSFVNLKKPCVNVFYFVRESADWKVDDIETRPKGEKPTRIAEVLRDFKDY
jgi:hypothetical protein